MKNKKYYPPITGAQSIKGFSLIEFLVASALSMIVLVAVSKGYFTARQLNSAADSRMNTQQDVRNAANMVVRDARMAGGFGCFNMAESNSRTIRDNNTATSQSNAFKLDNTAGNSGAVRTINRSNFNAANFTATSDALVFLYGADNPENGDQLVLSTCDTLVRPANNTKPANIAAAKVALGSATARDNEISVLRYAVHAYVTGSVGGQTGLFRFQLNGNNTWGNPQLLVNSVTSATFRYIYVNDCPDGEGNTEKFQYSNSLNHIPAFVRISLTGGDGNAVQIYNIDAAIRGGNTCANRSLS
ncbi:MULTISPECIES: PilW family protein [unclassified Neisseria]|uniref:PilW family protein n=1 Tax=unclassified Neisseria TaxID=2623750 RepID=UPI001072CFFC|nr:MULTISPECIES: prepilin-type N-terminal cleavage/methylation domain-containing protein [unclassified Neisseria]MBF0804820.1 prepilin-type N-terminal cleavage/methylation domain-containing protein [Neisseria sp. 19428wB4_WF04]TFU39477.1 pilus assembly protein PilW [Neisseria sp. WF04]